MRKSRLSQSGFAAPWVVMLASLLLLMALASVACGPKEETTEQTPAETAATTEAETPAETPAATPTPTPTVTPTGTEITIKGFMPPKWVNNQEKVGPGDKIIWAIGAGKHSLQFDPEPCKIAEAKMTFTPPLVDCESEIKTSGEIVSAVVNQALDADLPYKCGVHPSVMTGVLKPK